LGNCSWRRFGIQISTILEL